MLAVVVLEAWLVAIAANVDDLDGRGRLGELRIRVLAPCREVVARAAPAGAKVQADHLVCQRRCLDILLGAAVRVEPLDELWPEQLLERGRRLHRVVLVRRRLDLALGKWLEELAAGVIADEVAEDLQALESCRTRPNTQQCSSPPAGRASCATGQCPTRWAARPPEAPWRGLGALPANVIVAQVQRLEHLGNVVGACFLAVPATAGARRALVADVVVREVYSGQLGHAPQLLGQ